jgi:Endonuclease/Exonuclease/phosphatase family
LKRLILVGICMGMVFTTALSAQQKKAEIITFGTFNIVRLGEVSDPDRLERIAKICKGIDLLAIQEVSEFGTGVEDLAATMGSEYHYAVSGVSTHERIGLLWRDPIVMIKPCENVEALPLGRMPFTGYFRAGNFDFQVMVFHLYWDGSKKTYPHTRGVEVKLLDDWLCHRRDRELDLILMGDFNTPNMFFNNNFPPPYSFHSMFYEFMARHNLMSVSLEKRIPTSIVKPNIYDHIIFNPAHNHCEEFAGMDTVEVVQWEMMYDENRNNHLDWPEYDIARVSVTDHRLVKAGFRIDMVDDDDVP